MVDSRRNLLNKVTLDNNNVVLLDAQIKTQINIILKSISVVDGQNNAKILAIKEQIKLLEGQLYSLPEKELELTRLNRVLAINNKYLHYAFGKRNGLQFDHCQNYNTKRGIKSCRS